MKFSQIAATAALATALLGSVSYAGSAQSMGGGPVGSATILFAYSYAEIYDPVFSGDPTWSYQLDTVPVDDAYEDPSGNYFFYANSTALYPSTAGAPMTFSDEFTFTLTNTSYSTEGNTFDIGGCVDGYVEAPYGYVQSGLTLGSQETGDDWVSIGTPDGFFDTITTFGTPIGVLAPTMTATFSGSCDGEAYGTTVDPSP